MTSLPMPSPTDLDADSLVAARDAGRQSPDFYYKQQHSTTLLSIAIPYLVNTLALVGVGLFLIMLFCHLSAILFARSYFKFSEPRSHRRRTPDQPHRSTIKSLARSSIAVAAAPFCLLLSLVAFFGGCLFRVCSQPCSSTQWTRPEAAGGASPSVSLADVADSAVKPPEYVVVTIPPSTGLQESGGLTHRPGVTILKPVAGLDANIEANLATYFRLDYPVFELVFCLADSTDPAVPVIESLCQANPGVSSQIVFASELDASLHGVNAKVNNLQMGYSVAQHELLLISDAGVWMHPDTLTDMVDVMTSDARVGMVHQLPFIKPPSLGNGDSLGGDIGGSLSSQLTWLVHLIFFGCWHAKVYISAHLMRLNCTTGMSWLLRRSIVQPINGFATFGCYLAEDFFLSHYIHQQGWLVRLAHQPAWQNSVTSGGLCQFVDRLTRWSQLRLSMVPVSYAAEPLSRCLPVALLTGFSMAHFFPTLVNPGVWLACHAAVWFLLDYILLHALLPPAPKPALTRLQFLVGWFVCECLTVPITIKTLVKSEVNWRGRRYRLQWGGVTEEIKSPAVGKHRRAESAVTV